MDDQDFMTPAHRRVHHFTVRAIPGRSSPLPAEEIADALDIETAQVNGLLADLECHMTFLFRDKSREVTWAYPIIFIPDVNVRTLKEPSIIESF